MKAFKQTAVAAVLLFGSIACHSQADNIIGSGNKPTQVYSIKARNSIGTGARLMIAQPDGTLIPMANGQAGHVVTMVGNAPSWAPPSGSGSGTATVSHVHTSGTSLVVPVGVTWLVVNPSSTINTFSLTLPSSPVEGQELLITFGGTMTTGVVIGEITVTTNVVQNSTPTEIVVGDYLRYKFKTGINKWYRIF